MDYFSEVLGAIVLDKTRRYSYRGSTTEGFYRLFCLCRDNPAEFARAVARILCASRGYLRMIVPATIEGVEEERALWDIIQVIMRFLNTYEIRDEAIRTAIITLSMSGRVPCASYLPGEFEIYLRRP